MRKFSSYGPIINSAHYHAPRIELISETHTQLLGNNIDDGGHYFTVWAPRQCGKSWTLIQVLLRLQEDNRFYVSKINMEAVKGLKDITITYKYLIRSINKEHKLTLPIPQTRDEVLQIFERNSFDKPIILILDEFDALEEHIINDLVSIFREIYQKRRDEAKKTTFEKTYMLHGIALIGVRSVLGIENAKGSPFNVQRSVHIPNLTFDEVKGMFDWYTKESGQKIDSVVIDKLYYETNGQPGLVSWFGEMLTEEYNEETNKTIKLDNWENLYSKAKAILPNNTILNLISKAKEAKYKPTVLDIFETDEKLDFSFHNENINYLYMNGVIDYQEVRIQNKTKFFVKFSSPFVQKTLFIYFSRELFDGKEKLIDDFDELDDTLYDTRIDFRNLLKRYETYLQKNSSWLFKYAPRRSDMRIYEAVYHFNLYMYLYRLLSKHDMSVIPEFPTGNGKIDLLIKNKDTQIGLELKSYSNRPQYFKAVKQAAGYAKTLGLAEISLLFFIEVIDDKNRKKYEIEHIDEDTGVKVIVVFAQTGNV